MDAASHHPAHGRLSLLRAAPFFLSLTFLPVLALGFAYGGLWVLAAPLYGFVALPLIDQLLSLDEERIDPAAGEAALFWHKLLTWLWTPLQLALIVALLVMAGTAEWLAAWELVAMAVAVGIVTGGVGITYAHEMMHQRNRTERQLAEVLMCSTLYGHFCIEHVHGHHVAVATPGDPATARRGESIYRFLARAIPQGLASAWRIQAKQLARRGASIWSLRNAFWRYALWYAAFFATAFVLAGWFGVGLFILQAAIAVMLLEFVNYVEHYGLLRRRTESGKFETSAPTSLNSAHRLTNRLTIC